MTIARRVYDAVQHGALTVPELGDALPDLTPRQLAAHVAALCQRRLLVKVGWDPYFAHTRTYGLGRAWGDRRAGRRVGPCRVAPLDSTSGAA